MYLAVKIQVGLKHEVVENIIVFDGQHVLQTVVVALIARHESHEARWIYS